MKHFIVFVGLLITVNAVSFFELVTEEWNSFKLQHHRNYDDDTEEKYRMKIFMDNKLKIAKHNQRYEAGEVSYKLGLNKYADLQHHEFATRNGFNKTGLKVPRYRGIRQEQPITFISPANVQLPKIVDWRQKGAVTEMKDQAHCGSCWAFSTTGSLEGQYFRKTGVLISLSEQNLMDCSTKYGNNGCNGGLMDNAFRYIKENGGIDTEKSYPYEGIDDKCRYDKDNRGATDTGFIDIPETDELKLKEAVATIGPVSVAIDASHDSFQFYSDGIYYEPNCDVANIDHAVLAIGYGTDEKGIDYWLIKNSWGLSWGNNGYLKLARNRDNHCGVASAASYPLV